MSTTEAPQAPQAPQTVELSLDLLRNYVTQITQIDEKIAAASGSEDAARKAVIDGMIEQNKDKVDELFATVSAQLTKFDAPIFVGLITRLEDAIKGGDLKTQRDTVVDGAVKERLANTEQVDVDALKDQRKATLGLFRSAKQILDSLSFDTSSIEEPKRAGGRPAGSGGGKSGKNKEGYRYTMDGKDRPNSQNSFSSLAYYATEGLFMNDVNGSPDVSTLITKEGERLGAPQLRALLASRGVNFGQDDTWEIELPNGKKVGARRFTDEEKAAFEASTADDSADGEAPADETAASETADAPATV